MKRLFLQLGFLWASVMVTASVKAEMPTKIPPDKERGEALYRELCVGCHGPRALGNGPSAAAFGIDAEKMRLAGRFEKNDMEKAILTIQMGKGLMPAYEQQIDRHESKRILIWLNALDPVEGAPLPSPEETEKDSDSPDGELEKNGDPEPDSKSKEPASSSAEPANEQEQQ